MEYKMKQALRYIQQTLGILPAATPIGQSNLDGLPMYVLETFRLYRTNLFSSEIVLAEFKNEVEISIQQTEKLVHVLKNRLNQKVVVVLDNVQAYQRKRLIEKGLNFIVPGKQLYLPELLVSLGESFVHPKSKQKNKPLLPSAQFLLIYHIIHKNKHWNFTEHSFKEIAEKTGYTPMAITNAIDGLKSHGLVNVEGERKKGVRFLYTRPELWNLAQKNSLLVNPVLKTVYVDEKPKNVFLLKSNTSALPEYTDLNPSKQDYFAIEKTIFYGLQKENTLVNLNEIEGEFALEVWKYNPVDLVGVSENECAIVDPISLYLSLKDSQDERIQMALKQILETFIW